MIKSAVDIHNIPNTLGLFNLVKSWDRNVDPVNRGREENFHDYILKVLTFTCDNFDKKIQLVFFKWFPIPIINVLDSILDYPAHVLYEVEFDKNDEKTYQFFLPVKMWDNILAKEIPRNALCVKDPERIGKYEARGFTFV